MFVAIPLGLLAVDHEELGPRQIVVRGPTVRPETPAAGLEPSLAPAREAAPPGSASQNVNLKVIERIRTLPAVELERLVRRGTALERLSALHTLWVRGERAQVEALVAESGDRALVAKLEALRSRTK